MTEQKQKEFVVFNKKRFYPPYKCLCCGKEISLEQFCWGRLCAYCDLGKCGGGFSYEKGHGRKDILENAPHDDELSEIVREKIKMIEDNKNEEKV